MAARKAFTPSKGAANAGKFSAARSKPNGNGNGKGKGKFSMSMSMPSDSLSNKSKGKGKAREVEESSAGEEEEDDELDLSEEIEEEEQEPYSDTDPEEYDDDEEDEEPDTDEEIAAAQAEAGKSKKTASEWLEQCTLLFTWFCAAADAPAPSLAPSYRHFKERKRRATSPNSFGATLQSLLGSAAPIASAADAAPESDGSDAEEDDAEAEGSSKRRKTTTTTTNNAAGAANPILALAPHVRRSAQSGKLSAKASRALLLERKARLELTRVKDVIGGWGAPGQLLDPNDSYRTVPTVGGRRLGTAEMREWEAQGGTGGYEKKLRKVAQRGVVKLFNAIKAAQGARLEDVSEERQSALVRSVMPKGPAAAAVAGAKKRPGVGAASPAQGKKTAGSTFGGHGAKAAALKDLSKSNFLELIKAGSGSSRR